MTARYNQITIEEVNELQKQGYTFHHSASAKGYIRKGKTYIEDYKGKHGEGKRVHVENCKYSVSNKFHLVIYLLKVVY